MTFAADRYTSLKKQPYSMLAEMFLQKGQRVLSFDLPNHGERINEFGSDITGLRNAFISRNDPFEMFVEDAKAVIDLCIDKGLARPGRIVVSGTSRGGYMALRLLAADERICAAAAFAPVTDWRYLNEFAEDRNRQDVIDLSLTNYCDKLVGKPVFLAIGNHDTRVSTPSCCRLYLDLMEQYTLHGIDSTLVDFCCTNDKGHTLGDFWRSLGARFLFSHTIVTERY
jgi:dienelactone hydrolase